MRSTIEKLKSRLWDTPTKFMAREYENTVIEKAALQRKVRNNGAAIRRVQKYIADKRSLFTGGIMTAEDVARVEVLDEIERLLKG